MVIYLVSIISMVIGMVIWEAEGLNDFLAWGITIFLGAIFTAIFVMYGERDGRRKRKD